MTAELQSPSARRPWAAYVLSALPVLFFLFDGIIHLLKPAPVAQAFAQLGFPLDVSVTLGVLELLCVVLYVLPRTSLLGAVLFTGYLGGAIAANLRVANPLFSHTLFPIYVAILIWLGLYLRDRRLRALFPVALAE